MIGSYLYLKYLLIVSSCISVVNVNEDVKVSLQTIEVAIHQFH
jgi:hypothetical protein